MSGLLPFLFFYVIIYMGNAIYGTFMPVYLHEEGFSQVQIGTLVSMGPLIAILAQPVWGEIGDRAKTKNGVLALLLVGSGVSALLYPLSNGFFYLLVMICLFTFFQTSIFSMGDAITLEELDRRRQGSFGLIRLGGTVGFAVMSLIFGIVAKTHIGWMFAFYASLMVFGLLLLLRFPRVPGHRTSASRVRVWALFRNKKLMLYMSMNFVLQATLGYFYGFFPIYFKEMGGDSSLLGWSMVISSMSEVPFLLYSGRLFQRVGIPWILLGAALATTVRWYLFSIIHNPVWLLPAQALHGLMFIVLTVTMATFINREVPGELKASGQTLNGLINLGLARIVGGFVGGYASSAFGMRLVFFDNSIVAIACLLVYGALFLKLGELKLPARVRKESV